VFISQKKTIMKRKREKMSETQIKDQDAESVISPSFVLVLIFLVFNIAFSWMSPGWTDKLGQILIDEQEEVIESEKLPDIKAHPSTTTAKIGNIVRVECSIKGISARSLKKICDRKSETKLDVKGKTRKGDNVTLKYAKPFNCKGINLSINGPNGLRAQLQTSADGIVFSSVKTLKAGSNDVVLKNEKVKAVRILISKDLTEAWSLGDVSCR
jgi:hypothetical protein